MSTTSAPVDRGVDEFALAGLTPVASRLVKPPRVGESRVAMECKVAQVMQFKSAAGKTLGGWMVFGEVVAVHIDATLLKDGVYQTALARPLMRAGGLEGYALMTEESMRRIKRPPVEDNRASHGS